MVGDDASRGVPQAFEQLAKEHLGGNLVPPALHQDVEDVAILIEARQR
jgi:hypothetical protein